MGCSPSVNDVSSQLPTSNSVDNTYGKCLKHGYMPFTQYNEKDNELYCSDCFNDNTRSNVRNGRKHCVPISSYIDSHAFNQRAVRQEQELRKRIRDSDNEQANSKRSIEKIKTQEKDLIVEINEFRDTIITLLTSLAVDLCNNVSDVIKNEVNTLLNTQKRVFAERNTLEEIRKMLDIGNNTRSDASARLCSIIDTMNGFRQLGPSVCDESQVEVKLTLKKSLRLGDIKGKTSARSNVKLGEVNVIHVRCNNIGTDRQSGTATLTYIPENEDSEKSTNSCTESEMTSSQKVSQYNISSQDAHGHGEVANGVVTSNKRDNTRAAPIPMRASGTPIFSSATPSVRASSRSIVTSLSIATPSEVRVEKPGMIARTIKEVEELQFEVPSDKHKASINDSAFMNDESLVLCDSKNACLTLFNSDFAYLDTVYLESQPYNLTMTSTDEVAVSLPTANTICFIRIVSGKFSDKSSHKHVQTIGPCQGIAFIQGYILYTARNEVFLHEHPGPDRKYDRKFKLNFREPVSLTIDERNESILVSCMGVNTFGEVAVMKINGDIKFTISGRKDSHPVSCTLDCERNIYTCDTNPHRIHQYTPEGNCPRVLMESETEKYQHINFLPKEDIFLVTSHGSNIVKFYQMDIGNTDHRPSFVLPLCMLRI